MLSDVPQAVPEPVSRVRSLAKMLEHAFLARLAKVGQSCVPDLLNEIGVDASQAEAFEAIYRLEESGEVRRLPNQREGCLEAHLIFELAV